MGKEIIYLDKKGIEKKAVYVEREEIVFGCGKKADFYKLEDGRIMSIWGLWGNYRIMRIRLEDK